MNCQQFEDRFHDVLDHRQLPAADSSLQNHAAECKRCEQQLDAWCALESTFESSLERPLRQPEYQLFGAEIVAPSNARFGARIIVAVAAALLVVIGLWTLNQRPGTENTIGSVALSSEVADSAGSPLIDHRPAENIVATDLSADDAVVWWQSVQDRDWVDETMPAVRRIREGVAPIGRSLLKAVTILTGAGASSHS